MLKWLGIGFLYLLPIGYIAFMKVTAQTIEWFAVLFIFLMAIFITLYATVFKKNIEDAPENREKAIKIVKKATRDALRDIE